MPSPSDSADLNPSSEEDEAPPLRVFQVVAAQDIPFYGSFELEAATPEAALELARARLLDDASVLNDRESEGAHSLRVLALQENDQDPFFSDIALDPEAPLWPGPEIRAALLGSTSALAQLLASLGEAAAYPAELDQLSENLRWLPGAEAAALRARRAKIDPEAWVEQVMVWALELCEGMGDVPAC